MEKQLVKTYLSNEITNSHTLGTSEEEEMVNQIKVEKRNITHYTFEGHSAFLAFKLHGRRNLKTHFSQD